MAIGSTPHPPQVWRRPLSVIGAFAGVMLVYVIVHNEWFLVDPHDGEWPHIQPFKWWLLPHALTGACALLLGPMQFSDALRRRFARVHRVAGRIYVTAVCVAAPLGFYVQIVQEAHGAARSESIAAAIQATSWLVTTGVAYACIRCGKTQQHRQWMTRSFAVALIFLEVRFVLGVTGWERLGEPAIETAVWACNAVAILLADLALQWQDLAAARAIRGQEGLW